MSSPSAGAAGGRRRVLHVIGSLAPGGAERVAVELAMGLSARGWQADVLVAGAARRAPTPYETSLRVEASAKGVALLHVEVPSLLDAGGRARLRGVVLDGGYEIVHAHNRPQDWHMVALCRPLGVPALYTVHRSHELTARQRALYAVCARLAPAVVCVSQTVARHASRLERIPERKIRVIYNGIDLSRFPRQGPEERARKRAELGWAPDEFVWISVARLSEAKGHCFMIDAMREAGSGARLALAGDGELAGPLAAQVARLGLERRVQFLGSRTDVPALLAAADGFACASLTEGHPLSLLEAMAAGLPIVAPRLSAVTEIACAHAPVFFGPPHGALAGSHDPRELAGAMAKVEADAAAHRAAPTGAREHVAERFSLEAMLDAHERLYRDILAAAVAPSLGARMARRFLARGA